MFSPDASRDFAGTLAWQKLPGTDYLSVSLASTKVLHKCLPKGKGQHNELEQRLKCTPDHGWHDRLEVKYPAH